MTDETALIPERTMEEAAYLAAEFSQATRLQRYQEGRRPETLRRQETDLETFRTFLKCIGVQLGDFFRDLRAWQGVNAGLLESFIQWQKQQGYSIGTINVRLATCKRYCHLAFDVGILDKDAHIHIEAVKSIPRQDARNIDARREKTRVGYKKAQATEVPDDLLPLLKFPETGFLARRDALMMCLLLDHGLRVGELAILKKAQINLKTRFLTFDRPKVDKPQKDRLTKDTYRAAREYLPTIPAEQDSLFDLAITSIQERVRTLGAQVGIDHLSPHDCRHAWATRAAANGTPLDRLKQAGGWSNLQTPLRYIKDSEIANDGVILEPKEEA